MRLIDRVVKTGDSCDSRDVSSDIGAKVVLLGETAVLDISLAD